MKALHKLIEERVKPNFTGDGKLKRFWVVFDALETFLFTPGHTTAKGVHVRDGIDLKRTMFLVIVAMIPALLFGTWNIGHQYYLSLGDITTADPWTAMFLDKIIVGAIKVVPLIVVSYATGLGIEFVIAGINGHAINEGFLVSGMLIPLIMPVDVPLWMVAVATAFAVLIAKEVFGGTGMNILNVALTCRAFLFFAYPKQMSGEIWIHDVMACQVRRVACRWLHWSHRFGTPGQHRGTTGTGRSVQWRHVHVRRRWHVLLDELLHRDHSRISG